MLRIHLKKDHIVSKKNDIILLNNPTNPNGYTHIHFNNKCDKIPPKYNIKLDCDAIECGGENGWDSNHLSKKIKSIKLSGRVGSNIMFYSLPALEEIDLSEVEGCEFLSISKNKSLKSIKGPKSSHCHVNIEKNNTLSQVDISGIEQIDQYSRIRLNKKLDINKIKTYPGIDINDPDLLIRTT